MAITLRASTQVSVPENFIKNTNRVNCNVWGPAVGRIVLDQPFNFVPFQNNTNSLVALSVFKFT